MSQGHTRHARQGGRPAGQEHGLLLALAGLAVVLSVFYMTYTQFFSSRSALCSTMYSAAALAARLVLPTKSADVFDAASLPASADVAGGGDDLTFLTSSLSGTSSAALSIPKGLKPVKTVQFLKATGTRDENYGSLSVYNQTASHTPDIQKQLAIRPDVHLFTVDGPQVLILHSHTTESYAAAESVSYDPSASTRTTDNSRNVCRVGDEVYKALTAAGIEAIHDTDCYDYPDYDTAYTNSLTAIDKYLKQYPSIQVVLDIHRGAIEYSDGTRVAPTAIIGGKKAAQILIVTPCDESTALPVPDWQQNYRFGLRLQQTLQNLYPGLARPLALCPRRYNMQASHGSLLIEIGTDVNTLAEAEYSGQLLGNALGKLLPQLKG